MALKEIKMNYIVDVATKLFIEQSIPSVTIKDIADAADVGEATIYRYFQKKQNIVISAVMKMEKTVRENYFKLDCGITGFDKLCNFYKSYSDVYNEHPEFFKFIREFDLYMFNETDARLEEYETEVDYFKTMYLKAYELGLKDKSVKMMEDIETFYYSTTHALLELCKKHALSFDILSQDKLAKKGAEIVCLIDVILQSLHI